MTPRLLIFWCVFTAVAAIGSDARGADVAIQMEFIDPEQVAAGERPFITVDESGMVTYSDPEHGERHGRLGEDEHTALINELTVTLDVDAIDSARMWDEIVAEGRRTGLSPRIDGAAVTRIVMTFNGDSDREVVVECPACRLLSTRYPEVESLQRMAAAQSLLENLRAVMQVGGIHEAAQLAESANAHLASRGAGQTPFTASNLCSVRSLPDGALLITFDQNHPEGCTLSGTLEPGQVPMWIE